MEKSLLGQRDYLDAAIKTAQYLAGLTIQQDLWCETGKVLVNFFGADLYAIGEKQEDGSITGHHWTFSEQFTGRMDLKTETGEAIAEVLESGFLALRIFFTPEPVSAAFLPITLENRTIAVMVAGHATPEPLTRELLNVHLAVAGLVGTTAQRLASERELRRHRQDLEKLVKERTAELTEVNKQLHLEIGHRKEAEEVITELLLQNRMILESAGEGIYGLDLKGLATFVNPAAAKMTGYEPEELIGKLHHEILHHTRPDGTPYPREECSIYASLKTGTTHHVDDEVFWKKDGTSFPVEYTSTPIRKDGKLTGAVVVFKDISDRKQMEEEQTQLLDALQASQLRLSLAMNLARLAHWGFDTATNMFIFNDQFYSLYGTTAEREGGYQMSPEVYRREFVHPEDSLLVAESIVRAFTTPEANISAEVAHRIIRRDGELRHIVVRFNTVKDSSGNVISHVGANQDITEQKNIEMALAEKEEKFRTITNSAQDAIIMMDNDGKIDFWNPAAEKIFGLSVEEVQGKEMHALIAPQRYLEGYKKGFAHFRETGQGMAVGKTLELNAIRKGGEEFPVELSMSAINLAGKWHAVGILRDITERKQVAEEIHRLNAELEAKVEERTKQLLDAQEELVRKEKLSILGQLSGCVGHELRNPLGVMSNAVYFLKMIHADADETTKEYLDIIKDEIDNSQRIISDLLDFARTRTPQTMAVNVRELMDGSLRKCTIPDSVNLQTEIPDSLPLLRIDPLQMEQVFQNLITNAVQAMPGGGSVLISSTRWVEDGLEAEDFIAISIMDTGEGISPENMKKLFQPLFTTKARGIGLGLVVCKNLVEANGGNIKFESTPGKGTTFNVIFPVMEERA